MAEPQTPITTSTTIFIIKQLLEFSLFLSIHPNWPEWEWIFFLLMLTLLYNCFSSYTLRA